MIVLYVLLILCSISALGSLWGEANAATIDCDSKTSSSQYCEGTKGGDVMNADDGTHVIKGLGGDDIIVSGNEWNDLYGNEGNDQITGGDRDDDIFGGPGDDDIVGGNQGDALSGQTGDDKMDGGPGGDGMYGNLGADDLKGGSGDDSISHNGVLDPELPDGSKDYVDCGPGNDQVWINAAEGDSAVNCETINGLPTLEDPHEFSDSTPKLKEDLFKDGPPREICTPDGSTFPCPPGFGEGSEPVIPPAPDPVPNQTR
jgi:hypothetical protein